MKLLLLSRCLFCLALVSLPLAPLGHAAVSTVYYPSGPAGTIRPPTGFVGFEIPVERSGHSFEVRYGTTPNGNVLAPVKTLGLITASGIGRTAEVRSLLLAAKFPAGVSTWWIRDKTANQQTQVYTGAPSGSVSVLNALWTTTTGVPNRYFVIPDTRAGHGLIFGTLGGAWANISPMFLVGTYSAGTNGTQVLLPWYTAFATAPVASSATDFLADRTTAQKAQAGVGDVRLAGAWSADLDSYPLSWVQVRLEAREAGHAFTVHGTVPGAPEQLLRVTARANGAEAMLGFALGTQTDFWVSRDAEDGATNQPTAPSVDFWNASPAATFSAISTPSIFPDPPLRSSALVLHDFYVNARTRPGHQFRVQMSDGYSSTFGPAATDSVSAYETEQLDGWLSDGKPTPTLVPNPVPIYRFSVLVDPSVTVTLLDTTNGTQLGISPAINPTQWLDGWKPILTVPEANPAITLQLPSAHVMDYFLLRRLASDGWSSFLGATAFGSSRTFLSLTIGGSSQRLGLDGMADYDIEHSAAGFTHPWPAEAGPFLVDNLTTLQTRDGVFAGFNDLSEWFEPPKPLALQISSSRWGHRLVVRHPNGEFFPIQNGSIAGSTSAPATGPAWYATYYYFDASAVARSELPWYIEDVDTGERLGASIPLAGPTTASSMGFSSNTTAQVMPINPLAGPSNSALINWIAVPTPGPLTGAVSSNNGEIALRWPLSTLASDQGSFEVERQLGDQPWTLLATNVPATATDSSNLIYFSDPRPVLGYVHSYRVRYAYGADSTRHRSAPSNTVVLFGWLDSDGDGIPDWQDGGGESVPLDGDGDGVPDDRDPNPYWKDNPAVGLTVFGYTAP